MPNSKCQPKVLCVYNVVSCFEPSFKVVEYDDVTTKAKTRPVRRNDLAVKLMQLRYMILFETICKLGVFIISDIQYEDGMESERVEGVKSSLK